MENNKPYWYSRVSNGLLKDTGEEYFYWCKSTQGTLDVRGQSQLINSKFVFERPNVWINITEEQAILLTLKQNGDFLK